MACRRGGNIMKCQFGKGERVVSREGGMEFKDKIVLYSLRESKMYAGIHCRDLIIVI